MFKFFLVSISIGVASCAIYNYCDTKLCAGSNYKHITCESTGGPGPKCSSDSVVPLAISDEAKKMYVDTHNKLRNKFANGVPGFQQAAQMATMRWDDELAQYAALNILRCQYKHDCHATPQMPFDGQNIYAVVGAYENDMVKVAENSVKDWYAEIENTTMSDMTPCCPNLEKTGHFTQVIRDRADRVGCSAGHFHDLGAKLTVVTCNYSFGNLRDTPSYVTGAPASKCKSGNNPDYPALCSSAEQIDPSVGKY